MNGKKAKALRRAVKAMNLEPSRRAELVGGEYGLQVRWLGEKRTLKDAKTMYRDKIIEVVSG